MPYRIDLTNPPPDAAAALIDLGALDIEPHAGGLAALMPDRVSPDQLARVLGGARLRVSPASGRDDDSVWTLSPRPVRVGSFVIVPASMPAGPGALRIVDSAAFGTGLHATTALCLRAMDELLDAVAPARVLDVGTGSGILALAALTRGVPRVQGLDTDLESLRIAAGNARLNGLAGRLDLVCGDADAVRGSWPLVVANIRAAELMSMASVLARRLAGGGRLVLSGIPRAVAADVERAYGRLGIRRVGVDDRDGWTALVLRPSW